MADIVVNPDPIYVILALIVLLIINEQLFKRIKSSTKDRTITKTTIAFFILMAGIVAFVLSLEIGPEKQGYILTFLGIIISAGVALGSTTVLGNLIAGLMNKTMGRFRNGDLVKIGELHGRVTKTSVFHIEIQLEDSNFMSIPNLFIANNPVKLTRKKKTVISTSVSLGYDVSRTKIESALKKAALDAGLKDPYMFITSLDDFTVVYKIHGFLDDSETFFSTNSQLNAMVMDVLHERGIEIVSPVFMNQRRVDELTFIPKEKPKKQSKVNEPAPEEKVFDKANESAEIETLKDEIKTLKEKQEALKDELDNSTEPNLKESIKVKIEGISEEIEHIEQQIKSLSEQLDET